MERTLGSAKVGSTVTVIKIEGILILPWPGCFCVMDLNRNMVSGKSRISRKPLLGNHFSVGKICRFLISATAEIS